MGDLECPTCESNNISEMGKTGTCVPCGEVFFLSSAFDSDNAPNRTTDQTEDNGD